VHLFVVLIATNLCTNTRIYHNIISLYNGHSSPHLCVNLSEVDTEMPKHVGVNII